MEAAWILAGIGGATLLAAGIAHAFAAFQRSDGVKSAPAKIDGLGRLSTTPAKALEAAMIEIESDAAEPDAIEWQDSPDVYAPAPVVAANFVRTLGLARPPAMLANQAYIFVKRAALEKTQAHLRGNLDVEQGGLLLGQAFFDAGLQTYLLLVHDALPAPDGIETPTFFGYTTASWRALTPHLQQMNPDWTLIGSYHSHPNMGVFLSETDLDTQEDIFCADWQIALVIDPVKDEIGFFVGKDGQNCADWYLLNEAKRNEAKRNEGN